MTTPNSYEITLSFTYNGEVFRFGAKSPDRDVSRSDIITLFNIIGQRVEHTITVADAGGMEAYRRAIAAQCEVSP